jgi:hypothetical protein
MEFVSFPSIEGFHNVVKESKYYRPKLNYRGKIKIHGTNSAVAIRNGQIAAQSRTQFVTPTADNAGFAKWVENHREYFSTLSMDNHTIFGEWCGPGIMKGTAINQIPNKVFAIFAIQVGVGDEALLIVDPVKIESLMGSRPSDIYVLPWCCETFAIDFSEAKLTIDNANVTGTFNWIPFEKDSARGTLSGTVGENGEMNLLYDYIIEGAHQTEEKIMKIEDGKLLIKHGELLDQKYDGHLVYKEKTSAVYSETLEACK